MLGVPLIVCLILLAVQRLRFGMFKQQTDQLLVNQMQQWPGSIAKIDEVEGVCILRSFFNF